MLLFLSPPLDFFLKSRGFFSISRITTKKGINIWAYLAAFFIGLIELNIRAQNKCGFIIAPNKVPAVFFFIFFHDAQGKPGMVRFNGVDYFYVYNLQGDVVALIDANGTQVVEYGYDAWGNPISKTGSLAATIGTLNPFRYRGYVYDEETPMYYL